VVSAGGTREYLDPVRFLGNRSSGLQGYALARTAAARGAHVTLVSANVSLADPAGVSVVRVGTTEQLREAVVAATATADAVVVGFAAETGDASGSVLDLGRAKLARKGCDLLVVNDVSGGAVFGSADNEAVILGADGAVVEVPHGSKTALAHVIWDQVYRRFAE
jgi:phosphopantothenoylcysteine decarboxylase/phosphopantothenate--cysteine ligase